MRSDGPASAVTTPRLAWYPVGKSRALGRRTKLGEVGSRARWGRGHRRRGGPLRHRSPWRAAVSAAAARKSGWGKAEIVVRDRSARTGRIRGRGVDAARTHRGRDKARSRWRRRARRARPRGWQRRHGRNSDQRGESVPAREVRTPATGWGRSRGSRGNHRECFTWSVRARPATADRPGTAPGPVEVRPGGRRRPVAAGAQAEDAATGLDQIDGEGQPGPRRQRCPGEGNVELARAQAWTVAVIDAHRGRPSPSSRTAVLRNAAFFAMGSTSAKDRLGHKMRQRQPRQSTAAARRRSARTAPRPATETRGQREGIGQVLATTVLQRNRAREVDPRRPGQEEQRRSA